MADRLGCRGGRFRCQATAEQGCLLRALKLQNFALKVFIQEAFILAGWSRPFLSTKELNDHKKTFLDAIATIRAQAPILAQLPIHSSKMGLLHHLAAAYERAIEKLDPSYMIPVAKRPALGNPARRAYVLCMVALCRKIYGTPLYGTVANTANVVFKANLSSQQVREMTAGF